MEEKKLKYCNKYYRGIIAVLYCWGGTLFNAAIAADATKNDASQLHWGASVGLGYNSNIYRAPSDAYIDYAPATEVTVDPVTHSGVFVPLSLEADYQKELTGKNNFLANYRFSGELYVDSDFRNADETSHTIKIGDEFVLNSKGRLAESLYGGLILVKKEDEYTERDTGLDKVSVGDVNISDRYKYKANGIELKYDNKVSDIKYGFDYKMINRDFVDAIAISQLDHTYTLISGDVKIPINKLSKIKFKYSHYVYDYDDRPSRTVDGRAYSSNPPVKYVYNKLLISYLYKFSRKMKTFFDYSYTKRDDEYVGYNDYNRNKIKIRVLYDYSKKLDLKATVTYWDREYPNAYAFDRKVPGKNEEAKSYDGTKLELEGTYHSSQNRDYWVNFQWYDENTTDLRYQYERVKIITGVSWEY